jgi:hypothetical protein
MIEDFKLDNIFGERLLISTRADQSELLDNIRAARILLSYFDDMYIQINEHLMTIGHKNPEYTINGKLADRKGLESEDGIKSAFRKAKIQGCQTIVLDFDMHMPDFPLKTRKIANGLYGRHEDFMNNCISECYIIHQNKAILITSDLFFEDNKDKVKNKLIAVLEKIRDIT